MPATTRRTRSCRSRKTASIGKAMNAVWIDPVFVIMRPSPGARPFRPSRPRIRVHMLDATSQFSTTARPLSSARALDKRRRAGEEDGDGAAEAQERAVGERGAKTGAARDQQRSRPDAAGDDAQGERRDDLRAEQEA